MSLKTIFWIAVSVGIGYLIGSTLSQVGFGDPTLGEIVGVIAGLLIGYLVAPRKERF